MCLRFKMRLGDDFEKAFEVIYRALSLLSFRVNNVPGGYSGTSSGTLKHLLKQALGTQEFGLYVPPVRDKLASCVAP
jgi:hypothetical protein